MLLHAALTAVSLAEALEVQQSVRQIALSTFVSVFLYCRVQSECV